jgi:hypothetical protein
VRWSIKWILAGLAGVAWAGPVDFGLEQFREALASRDRQLSAQTELSLDPPGSYRIVPLRGGVRVSGGDLRGLMYGLLEAADQIRASGTVRETRAQPELAVRGVRVAPTEAQLSDPSYFNFECWRATASTI